MYWCLIAIRHVEILVWKIERMAISEAVLVTMETFRMPNVFHRLKLISDIPRHNLTKKHSGQSNVHKYLKGLY